MCRSQYFYAGLGPKTSCLALQVGGELIPILLAVPPPSLAFSLIPDEHFFFFFFFFLGEERETRGLFFRFDGNRIGNDRQGGREGGDWMVEGRGCGRKGGEDFWLLFFCQ